MTLRTGLPIECRVASHPQVFSRLNLQQLVGFRLYRAARGSIRVLGVLRRAILGDVWALATVGLFLIATLTALRRPQREIGKPFRLGPETMPAQPPVSQPAVGSSPLRDYGSYATQPATQPSVIFAAARAKEPDLEHM